MNSNMQQLIMQRIAAALLSVFLIVLLTQCSCTQARRVDCTKFVFAPICRGVAAKRSSNIDIDLHRTAHSPFKSDRRGLEEMSGNGPSYDNLLGGAQQRPVFRTLDEPDRRSAGDRMNRVRWQDVVRKLMNRAQRQELMEALQENM